MSIVKGTKQHRVKVVRDRPFLRVFVLLVLLGVTVGAVAFSFRLGHSKGMQNENVSLAKISSLQDALSASDARVAEFEQKMANVDLGAEVDRKANEEIRQEVIALKESIAKLEEENSFYRGLMAPTKNKRGLAFGAIELSKTDRARTVSYKVVMQQLATNHQLLKGSLEYKVVGRQDGVDAMFNLRELSSQVKTDLIKLRFKYFQTIEGELKLPEGFEPVGIELVAKSTGKNPVTVEKRFDWLVEEVL